MKHWKQKLAVILACLLTFSTLVTPYAGAAETPAAQAKAAEVLEDGYIPVRTVEDLYNIRNDLSADYRLMNDIDLTEATAEGGEWDFMGNGWNPIGSKDIYGADPFTGTFDGGGHAIIGMRIEVKKLPAGAKNIYLGLFAQVNGTVCNLQMVGGSINTISLSLYENSEIYTGSITGNLYNGTISNSSNTGVVSCKVKNKTKAIYYAHSGGICGTMHGGAIINCYNLGEVSSDSGEEYGSSTAAGIVGEVTSGSIKYCYNNGKISSNNMSCGIGRADRNSASVIISDCYNTGYIEAKRNGKLGSMYGISFYATVIQCYNIGQTTPSSSKPDTGYGSGIGGSEESNHLSMNNYYLTNTGTNSVGATELTEVQMRLQSVFAGFDFDSVWMILPYGEYPYPQLRSIPQNTLEVIKEIRLLSPPDRVVYRLDEPPVYEGGQIEVVYTSGKTERVDITADNTSGVDTSHSGLQTATVTFRNKTVEFDVYVTDASMNGLNILSEPSVQTYLEGQPLNTEGLVVSASFDDGSSQILTRYQMTGYDTAPGQKTVTVSFNGFTANFSVTVNAKSLTGLELTKAPDKRTYLEGDGLDLDGLILTAIYDNGDRDPVSPESNSGYDATPGTKTVKLTFGGRTVSFKVLVEARSLVSLEVSKLPDKQIYLEGDAFEQSGMTVLAHYDNHTQEEIHDYQVEGYDSTPGDKTVTVVKGDCRSEGFTVTVTPRVLQSIAVTRQPRKTGYLEGDEFEKAGLEVTAYYNNHTEEVVEEYELNGYTSTPGKKTIIVSYQGRITTFPVTVSEKTMTELVLTSKPKKLTYLEGEDFEEDGLVVTARYNNQTEQAVTGYQIDGYDSTPGTKTVTVTYGLFRVQFPVEVKARSVSKLVITKKPNKTEYLEGQGFEPDGLEVTAQYDNGDSEVVREYQLEGYDSTPGSKTIVVTYGGQRAEFTVNVKEKSLSSITITRKPTKTEYVEGQQLDTNGLAVSAVYDNGDTEPLTEGYFVSGFESTVGQQTVVVTYKGKTASFPVQVIARVATGLTITHDPHKVEYLEGDSFESEGLTVALTYNDGTTEAVDEFTLTGYSAQPGQWPISVMCGGFVQTFQVTVKAKTLTHITITYPKKLTYYVNEPLEADGLTVTAHYDNGKAVLLEKGEYQLDGFSSEAPGNKTVTVSYQGKKLTFDVSVLARPVPEAIFRVGEAVGRAGDTVTVAISVRRNPGIAGFRHVLRFDSAALQFVSAETADAFRSGTLVTNEESAASGEITLVWFASANVRDDGEVYTLTFRILQDAVEGSSAISLSFAEKDNLNTDGERVFFQTNPGKVEVVDYMLGDLDGNRTLGMKDVLLLAQYVSGQQSVKLSAKQLLAADVNEDGEVDLEDVVLLTQWLLE